MTMISPELASSVNSRPASVIFTDNAAAKVSELILDEGNLALKLRVFIQGGGCSGFQYGFTFDDQQRDDDTVVEKQVSVESKAQDEDEGGENTGSMTVQLLVDPMSFQYLVGAEIDYKKDVSGEQFIIRNPNAKTTCGCGSSFSA